MDLPAEGFAEADGLRLFFRTFGAGPPLMLVHGWGSDGAGNWMATGWVDALSSLRTLIVLDVRGHGRSDKPHRRALYSYGAMSRDVLAVMDQLEIDRCDYLGYSMGAFMGAYLLGHQPGRFHAMALGGIGDETAESAAQGAAIAQALRAPDRTATGYAAAVHAFVAGTPGHDLEALACSAEQMWPEGYALAVAGEGVSRAELPVLVINGSEDHPYVDSADAFAAALPNARHERIPGLDHLSAVTSERFRQTVVDFFSGSAAGSPS